MDRLQTFYKSREWEKFRRVIIAERMEPDTGFVRCALCGEPIVHRYDLIVHHKRELTESNVGDSLISLNPDNVECVHFKCHNAIHERFQGGNGGWVPPKKKVYIVYGAPCSGKTTWANETASRNDLIADIDSLWAAVTGGDRYAKPKALSGVVFGLRDKLYDDIKYRSGRWYNAYVIAGGATAGERERLQARVDADDLIFIDTPKDVCLERLEARDMREKEREEWRGYIETWFERAN